MNIQSSFSLLLKNSVHIKMDDGAMMALSGDPLMLARAHFPTKYGHTAFGEVSRRLQQLQALHCVDLCSCLVTLFSFPQHFPTALLYVAFHLAA